MADNHYEELLAILARHLSDTHARLTLDRSLRSCGISDRSVPARALPAVIPRVKNTATLFLDRRRFEEFEKELKALWTPAATPLSSKLIPIREEADIVGARGSARELCVALGGSMMSIQRVATVVSEFARNIVSYTPGGEIELIPMTDPPRIMIRARDTGKGITKLDEIMAGKYKSKTGLGRGILGSRQLAERMEIETGADGTRIEAVMRL